MRYLKHLALLSTLALLFSPATLFARDKNQHTVNIAEQVQVGSTQLNPGTYKMEWQGQGSNTHVKFMKNGKVVATAAATLKTNDPNVTQDDVVMRNTSANKKMLEEIDIGHQKEVIIFGHGRMARKPA